MSRFLYLLFSLAVLLGCWLGFGPVRPSKTLILAHNLDTEHPVHKGMQFFAETVREESQGKITIKLYPNGQLGNEREVLEQVQIGAVSFTKVSSLSLESFSPLFGAINAPYIFSSEGHAFAVLDGPVGKKLLESPLDQRLRGLTFYAAGARSFYANKPILEPQDLGGLKMRVMGSQTAIKMMQLLGGSPVPMPYGEIYTALQQSVIDGAESNVTALTMSRHGEVAKHLSLDEHIVAPDVLLVSTAVWDGLDQESQELLRRAAEASKLEQRRLWQEAVGQHTRRAVEEMGVTVHPVEKGPFVQLVRPLHEEMKSRSEDFRWVMETIESTSE